jgi:hypothetical protein
VTIDVDGHVCDAEAARLLPWLVTDRLSAADAERVTAHVEHCEICRADLADQRALRATMRSASAVEYAPQAGLAKTMARIDELAREPAAGPDVAATDRHARSRRPQFGVTQWLTAAVILQAIGLGAIGGSYLVRQPADRGKAAYETLSTPAAVTSGARIRAVFAEGMTIARLKELLAAQHLVIVSGPSEAGVFTLGSTEVAPDRDRRDLPLAALRADPSVLFAEPLAGNGPPQ